MRFNTNRLLILLAVVLPLAVHAQQFGYRALVDQPDSTGFYRIGLSPVAVGLAQPQLADVRLYYAKGQEVPYLLGTDARRQMSSSFMAYPVVTHQLTDSSTVLVLHNKQRKRIDNICLFVANADVQKTMRLTGSNDREVWYSVKEAETVHAVKNPNDVAEIKVLNFPLVDYEFLRLDINDKTSSPLNVKNAGYYVGTDTPGGYCQLDCRFVQADSARRKTSYLTIAFDSLAVVDKLDIRVGTSGVYLRRANVYALEGGAGGEKRFLTTAILKKDEPFELELVSEKCRALLVEIANDDNPPIQIAGVDAWMLNRYCIAHLEKGQAYTLKFGNADLAAPRYDLDYFRSEVMGAAKPVAHGKIEALQLRAPNKAAGALFAKPWFIWTAIVMVVALLGYMTWGMMKPPSGRSPE